MASSIIAGTAHALPQLAQRVHARRDPATGLVMRHELSPEAQATLTKLGEGISAIGARVQSRRFWATVGGGLLLGLLAAGLVWWWLRSSRARGSRARARTRSRR